MPRPKAGGYLLNDHHELVAREWLEVTKFGADHWTDVQLAPGIGGEERKIERRCRPSGRLCGGRPDNNRRSELGFA
jgi:hypothetical protein